MRVIELAKGTSEPTVSAAYTKALLEFAVSRGAEEARLLPCADISADDLHDPDNRVPFARYIRLMRAAKALTGDPAFALEYGAATDDRRFSIVGLIAHASATMSEALVQINRYCKLAIEVDLPGGGSRFDIVSESGACWMIDRRANPNAFPELTEVAWSRFICGIRRAFPKYTYALAAQVKHQAPPHHQAYERLWRVPVTFNAHRNAIQIPPDFGNLPIQPENRYVFGVLTERGDALLDELERQRSARGRVESMLLPLLHTGDVGVETIAQKMETSRQTLYRMLKAEGVTFEGVLDELRHRMALHYLAGKRVSVRQTAYLVGFSDPAAFSRAFKRWTGRSPRNARAAKAHAPPRPAGGRP
jgi:AraC-like DNA-binding protein